MNGVRGETGLEIDGVTCRLCLTLGALAEIETAFGCTRLSELEARMRVLSGAELIVVLGALLRGGGHGDVAGRLGHAEVTPGAAMRAVGQAFHAALV